MKIYTAMTKVKLKCTPPLRISELDLSLKQIQARFGRSFAIPTARINLRKKSVAGSLVKSSVHPPLRISRLDIVSKPIQGMFGRSFAIEYGDASKHSLKTTDILKLEIITTNFTPSKGVGNTINLVPC